MEEKEQGVNAQENAPRSPEVLPDSAEPVASDREVTAPQVSADFNETVITDSDATDGYSPLSNLASKSESMVSKLLSTRGHLSFDQLSGRLRYFGPTTNCHVHSQLRLQSEDIHRLILGQRRRTQKVIDTLSPETHDYLLSLFWQYYNSVIHVIHQAAFEEGRHHGGGQFYSGFLHLCVLATGYKFADHARPDISRISISERESILHREAKFMLDYEIEQPAGISSISALLLLGDLECGVGRDNVGWLYAGMANRLCFDIGLHLDGRHSGLSQREIEIGRMTLLACVIYDKYWALFLGRPTSLKSEDLAIYSLSHQFERLGQCQPAGPEKSLETLIYEVLLDLMDIAGKITEIMDQASRLDDDVVNSQHHVYAQMANLNRELEIWYTRLPRRLKWTPENVESAPFSFFLLHQQYHVTMILLHRPFAKYVHSQAATAADGSLDGEYPVLPNIYLSSMSSTICTQHAVRVAQIFWRHRQRFDTRHIFVTGLQHAGTAAIALVAALASLKDSSSRDANMHYLECISAALEDMSHTYQPAERMSAVLKAVIVELRAALPAPKEIRVVPARRESTNDEGTESFLPSKRHQPLRPSPPRSLTPSFHTDTSTTAQQEAVNNASLTEARPPPLLEAELQDTRPQNSLSLDDFVVVTPRTDATNGDEAWPPLGNSEGSTDNYGMLPNQTLSGFASIQCPPSVQSQMPSDWMTAETPARSPQPTAATSAFEFQSPSFQRRRLIDRLHSESINSNVSSLKFLTLLSSDRNDVSEIGTREHDFAPSTPTTNFQARPGTSYDVENS